MAFRNMKACAAIALSAAMVLQFSRLRYFRQGGFLRFRRLKLVFEHHRLRCLRREEGRRHRRNAARFGDEGRQCCPSAWTLRSGGIPCRRRQDPRRLRCGHRQALANIFGLEADPETSNFDSIIPSVGSKYDIGISSFTITKERMEAVDFVVSMFEAGSPWKKGNPE